MLNENISKEKILSLAGLLHDIGKFAQRAEIENDPGFEEIDFSRDKDVFTKNGRYLHAAYTSYFIEKYLKNEYLKQKILSISASHHKDENEITKADRYSASMDRIIDESQPEESDLNNIDNIYPKSKKIYFKTVRQESIFDKIKLYKKYSKKNKIELSSFSFENFEDFFPKPITDREYLNPKEGQLLTQRYKELWNKFIDEFQTIEPISNFDSFYNQLYYLLQKYTSSIPSSTINYPDISLFDHLRTTAAIASCLNIDFDFLTANRKKFIFLEGDISGIQNFIFKITSSEDRSKVAKRLRGRSFYIMLLTEFFSKYIVNELDLPITNILYSGGGRFQMILPYQIKRENKLLFVEKRLNDMENKINEWLDKKYDGLISLIFATSVEEFSVFERSSKKNYSDILYEINLKLQDKKNRKQLHNISTNKDKFFVVEEEIDSDIRKCRICGAKLKKTENDICDLCKQHERIGTILTKDKKIVLFSNDEMPLTGYFEKIDFEDFGKVYILTNPNINILNLINNNALMDAVNINYSDNLSVLKAFKPLADTVPKAIDTITERDINSLEFTIEKDSPLTFELISKLSFGDKKLAVLKMDVDNLGMTFAMGFEEDEISISRIASLSRNLDMFFGSYLNDICYRISEKWFNDVKNSNDENLKKLADKITNIFYITYAGGDDLFIVGPWDYTIDLALEIRKELKRFTGYNPNIDISGSITIFKNKFPISIAASIAEESLEKSKNLSPKKGMINIFNTLLSWEERDINEVPYKKFENILNLSKRYSILVGKGEIPRTLIHFIYKLNLEMCNERKECDPNFIPKLFYKLYRTLDKEVADDMLKTLVEKNYFKEFRFIGSYILEKTRGGM